MTESASKVKLVIFDLDGTVFISQLCFTDIREELGISDSQPILESIAMLPCAKDREYYHQQIRQVEQESAQKGFITKEAIEIFDMLEERNIAMAIWTRNSLKATHISLGAHQPRFCHIETRECSEPKPKLDGLYRILNLSQVSLSEALFIGDSSFDQVAGQASGIKTLLLKGDRFDSEFVEQDGIHIIDDLFQITKHL